MDHQIGRILDAIPENQRASTFIIFTADSGLAVGSHGLFGKQNLYEHSMRVPLIIAGPGVAANRSTPALVYLHDLFPTMAALAELPSLDRSRGLNLSPVLLENQNVARKHITTSYRHLQRAVTDGRWKCIDYPLVSRTQLFDLSSDPSEIHDLSTNPTHATTLASLRSLLPDISHQTPRKKSP
jgi:arylsulfatase A-like enzyme